MKNENGSALSSYLMGLIIGTIGLFTEPMLVILGAIIIVSGAVAKFFESRRLKFEEMEAERVDKELQNQVA